MGNSRGFFTPNNTCNHCGGIMREYLGLVTCMMCGRIEEHHCSACDTVIKESIVKTA